MTRSVLLDDLDFVDRVVDGGEAADHGRRGGSVVAEAVPRTGDTVAAHVGG